MKVLCINMLLPFHSEQNDIEILSFDSFSSISEGDLLIYSSEEKKNLTMLHKWKDGLEIYDPVMYYKCMKHWISEIKLMLDNGKNIFVILAPSEDFYLNYDFPKKNKRINNNMIWSEFGIECLPSKGKLIQSTTPIFNDILQEFSKETEYAVHLKTELDITHNITSKGGDKIVGGVIKYSKGNLIFLPYISFEKEEYYPENEGEEDSNEAWNAKGISRGKIFIKYLKNILESLKEGASDNFIPEWVNEPKYRTAKEKVLLESIELEKNKIQKLESNIVRLQSKLYEEGILARLLYGTGKKLEESILEALRILGYKVSNYDDGHTEIDVVAQSPEGIRYIGECEGKDSKAIDVDKERQLYDAMREDFEIQGENAIFADGILFGNAQRKENPVKRNLDFTEKCKRSASRDRIAMVRTVDLYDACKYIVDNPQKDLSTFKKTCREAISKHMGKLVKFPKLPK